MRGLTTLPQMAFISNGGPLWAEALKNISGSLRVTDHEATDRRLRLDYLSMPQKNYENH